jgi:hypothetical protein
VDDGLLLPLIVLLLLLLPLQGIQRLRRRRRRGRLPSPFGHAQQLADAAGEALDVWFFWGFFSR